jgi:hypothetical protein
MDRGMYLAVRAHLECRGTEDLLPVYQGDMVPGADAVNVDVGVATCAPSCSPTASPYKQR